MEWSLFQDSEETIHSAEKKLPHMKAFSLCIDKKQQQFFFWPIPPYKLPTEIVHRRTYIQWLWFYSNALSIQAWILRHKQVTGCDFFASKLAGTIKPRTSGASWSFERIGMIIQWTMECLFMGNKFAISKWPCVKEIWFWLTKLDIF